MVDHIFGGTLRTAQGGQKEGSRGHTNSMYYVTWIVEWIFLARVKSLEKKPTVIIAFFFT